jgi:hypothetical protein
MLYEFTNALDYTAADYWWLDVTGGPSTVQIGNIVFGPIINLGYSLKPDVIVPVPLHEPIITAGGYEITTKIHEPVDTKVFTFSDPSILGDDIFDRKKSALGAYPARNTLWRHARHMRNLDLSATSYTGVSMAGGQVPVLYHEGTENQLATTTGRPAFYGYMRFQFMRNQFRSGKHVLIANVRDVNPKGPDIQPNAE